MLDNLIIKKVESIDLDLLVNLRIEVLKAANQLGDEIDMSHVECESRKYYQKYLGTPEHMTLLAYLGDNLAGCGSICFFPLMPTYSHTCDISAYIMNMYTRPEFRRQGIARAILDLLVKESQNRNVTKLTLEASQMGRPLYESYGFVTMRNEMILPN